MIVNDFTLTHSVLQHFVAQLRDKDIQQDQMRFRHNINRIGEVLSYEMSKTLTYIEQEINTPLGTKEMQLPQDALVAAAILRAGLPLQQGVTRFFEDAEQAFISAFRNRNTDGTFDIVVNYLAAPSLEGKTLILCDPMLATGYTLETVYLALTKYGTPKKIHIISVIGSKEGIAYIKDIFPADTTLWIAAVDTELSAKKYIIPGLGDAGDLSFGDKIKP